TELGAGLKALDKPSAILRLSLLMPDDESEEEFSFTMKFAPAIRNDTGVLSYYGQFEGHPDIFLLSARSYVEMMAPVLVNP
ncbi:MAG: hypothetical protein ACI8UO_002057, partial [Verrucomicrobiales bacterium]